MNRRRIPLARPTAVALGLLQAVLLLAVTAPRMVWCHKPDGRIALEIEAAPGECHCEQCALCREREWDLRRARAESTVSLVAAHCRHDEIRSEAARVTCLVRDAGGKDPSAAPAIIPNAPPVPPARQASSPSFSSSSSSMDAGPPGGILRC